MLTDLQIVSQVIIEKTQLFNSKVLYSGGEKMEGMDKMERKPIRITDTTLRDGHQSSLATRMRTEDMVPIA